VTICIALLRAVNVGGRNLVAMSRAARARRRSGLTDARTLLQSGNCVFDAGRAAPAELERRLERAARERLGLETTFFVRTATEWRDLVAANPFPAEAASRTGTSARLLSQGRPRAKRPPTRSPRRFRDASACTSPAATPGSSIRTAPAARS
jgi:uncharacterized protein (DUF1697 family)